MTGRMVEVSADLTTVTIAVDGRRRPRPIVGVGRHGHRPRSCRLSSAAAGCVPAAGPTDDPLRRDLADYDRALGVTLPDHKRRRAGGLMPTDPSKEIVYLATALKAPRIRDAAARPATQAREAGRPYEDYLVAIL